MYQAETGDPQWQIRCAAARQFWYRQEIKRRAVQVRCFYLIAEIVNGIQIAEREEATKFEEDRRKKQIKDRFSPSFLLAIILLLFYKVRNDATMSKGAYSINATCKKTPL